MTNFTISNESIENPECIHFNPDSLLGCPNPTCVTEYSRYCQLDSENVVYQFLEAYGVSMKIFVAKVDDAIVKNFISVEKKIIEISQHVLSNSYSTYHLFLVDFIVASDGSPKLIEINTLQ